MALILKHLYKHYFYYMEECKDTRLNNYFLMGSPIKVIAIALIYLYLIKNLGPKLMENRKPFELKTVMMIYNAFQVISNTMLATYGIYKLWEFNFSMSCQLVDYSYSTKGMLEAKLTYCYYMLKVIDLMDTVFFVLRKKYSQISFLHVYHHVGMVIAGYIFSRYMPGGHAALLGIINCYVHVVMYSYYFLTSFKPELRQSIWWKKHITQLQMLQFTILIIHFIRPLFYENCQYPKFWLFVAASQNLFMLILFSDFYIKTYIKKTKKKHIAIE